MALAIAVGVGLIVGVGCGVALAVGVGSVVGEGGNVALAVGEERDVGTGDGDIHGVSLPPHFGPFMSTKAMPKTKSTSTPMTILVLGSLLPCSFWDGCDELKDDTV